MKSQFEYFYDCGKGIAQKTQMLQEALKSSAPKYLDGLRMTLLEGVKPITKVRMPSGEVKEMLMLGSNSFLNLN
ncbi:MAG: hypothetical protein J6T16_00650, partial [Opitutales bacterium]|nr:hypothetical protein [Opitutales bacterium]